MNISPINFTGKCLDTIQIKDLKDKKTETMDFVEYETDFYDLIHLKETVDEWNKSGCYLANCTFHNYVDVFAEGGLEKRFFGLEDKDGNIQALAGFSVGTDNIGPNEDCSGGELSAIIVNPKNWYKSKDRRYKGLGAGLFSEIVKYSKAKGITKITLFNVNDRFWSKIPGFDKKNNIAADVLEEKNYETCLKGIDEII